MSLKSKIKTFAAKLPFNMPMRVAGNVIDANGIASTQPPVRDQRYVKEKEPYGTSIPKKILDRASGWSQLQNLSHEFTIEKVQSAFRQAETGDTRMLFGYLRDFVLGNGMVSSELAKRKLSTISEPYSIIPADKKNLDDVKAAEVIKYTLDNCPSFNEGLLHMLNSVVFPVACLEKIFETVTDDYNPLDLRYKLKELYAVDYNLINYRLPYIPQGPINIGHQPVFAPAPLSQNMTGRPEDTIFDPDSWEPNLRFWSVFSNGLIDFSYANMMAPDPHRHLVYRCDPLHGIARENWLGVGRSLLFLAIMSQLGLDVFLRCLQKWGVPFIVARVDTSQVDTVNSVMAAFENINIINGLVLNKDAIAELEESNLSGAADAHEKFLNYINDQISLLIGGQTLGSHAKGGGLGDGTANLHASIRADIIKYDQKCLNNTLRSQLFKQILEINGIKGNVPSIVWGGSNSIEDSKNMSITLYNLAQAGLEPSEESLDDLSIKFGFNLQKKIEAPSKDNNAVKDEENIASDDDNKQEDKE